MIIDDLRIKVLIVAARNGLLSDPNKTAGSCEFLQTNEAQFNFYVRVVFSSRTATSFFAARSAPPERFDGRYPLISTSLPLASKYLMIFGLLPL